MKAKVLIVDDEDFFRKVLAVSFEREGFTVLQTDNGVDAIRLARQEVPDLIILDLVMPGLLGFEVCLALRQDEKFDRTAIVVTSAKSFKPDIDKAMELGADAYIVKPVEFADLLEVGREHMNKRVKAV